MRRHIGKIILGVLAVLIVATTVVLVTRSPRAGRELEQYKADLRARGEKLTLEELGPGNSTNAMISRERLLTIAGRLPHGLFFNGQIAAMQYVAPGRARVAWMAESAASSGRDLLWDEAISRLDLTYPILLEIRDALKQPGLESKWDPDEASGSTDIQSAVNKRYATLWTAGAAIVEMRRGRLNDAAENLESLVALGRVQRDDPSSVQQAMRIAIAQMCLAVAWELLQTNGWNDAQLSRMQSALQSLGPLAAYERGLLGSRAVFLDQFAAIRSEGKWSGESGGPVVEQAKGLLATFMWQPEEDELFFLQNMQLRLDCVRSIAAHHAWGEAKPKLDRNQARIDGIARSFSRYRYLISLIELSNRANSLQSALETETQRDLAVTAIALQRYQLRHGKPAQTLAALVPEFLPAPPYDCMSGKSLGYRVNKDGTCVLYSAGRNGVDDGGDPAIATGTKPGLWEGRDAVWPQAAK